MDLQVVVSSEGEKTYIKGPFSLYNNRIYRSKGGKFNDQLKRWEFVSSIGVTAMLENLFGVSEELVVVAIGMNKDLDFGDNYGIKGYKIVSRRGRDTPVEFYKTAYLIDGDIPLSGAGSMKNPRIYASPDCVFGLTVRKDFAIKNELFILKELKFNINDLKVEKEKLMKRIAEIDTQIMSESESLVQ